MSPKLKRLSGKDVVAILSTFGFSVYSQKGSHVKLRRVSTDSKQTLTIAMHDELDIGTAGHYETGESLYSGRSTQERILF